MPLISAFCSPSSGTDSVGDLAQRHDRVLVVVALERQLGARRHVARALRREQHELEPVGDFDDAIFDGDARHGDSKGRTRVESFNIWGLGR